MKFSRNKALLFGIPALLAVVGLGYWEQTKSEPADNLTSQVLQDIPQEEAQYTPEGQNLVRDNPSSLKEAAYPNDFILQDNEIPAGFELEPLSDEAKKLGFTSNPGFFNDPELHKILYDGANSSRITDVYVAGYAKPEDPSTELGIFAVHYASQQDLEAELQKILQTGSGIYSTKPIYLRHRDVLVIIWSDIAEYRDQMEEVAAAFQTRLHLVPIAG